MVNDEFTHDLLFQGILLDMPTLASLVRKKYDLLNTIFVDSLSVFKQKSKARLS